MVETAAHLVEHVLPPLPVRQWLLVVPKRLRYFLHDDAAVQGVVLRIFLHMVERCLREHSPGCSAAARLGAVVFIHRFGSSLNAHLHFHCCILDGVFESAGDHAGLERLLRYCARPPFALEPLQQHEAEHLLCHIAKPRPDGPSTLVLTSLALIDKIAALVPPPRIHRQRYYGVLASNAPLRTAVTALAPVPAPPPPPADPTGAQEEPRHHSVARYLWAMLLARIYETFPLPCPLCHAEMQIIAFINEVSPVRQLLDHLGEPTRPPRIAPARGPPLWEAAAASPPAGNDPHWELATQPLPQIEFDQRLAW